MSFKLKYSFRDRIEESTRILLKYPDKIPIICEKNIKSYGVELNKKKYLINPNLMMSEFLSYIRKKLNINQNTALFLSIGDVIPPNTSTMGVLYEAYKNMDGYLYISYSLENTFG